MSFFFFILQTELVVVHTKDGQEVENIEIENVQIITDGEEGSAMEGVQVSEDYIIINDPASGCIKIMDSKSGELVAVVPSEGEDNQVQTITMSEEGSVSMVTLMAEGEEEGGGEMVTLMESGVENTVESNQVTEEIHIIEGVDGLEHSEVQKIIANVNSEDLISVSLETSDGELNIREEEEAIASNEQT